MSTAPCPSLSALLILLVGLLAAWSAGACNGPPPSTPTLTAATVIGPTPTFTLPPTATPSPVPDPPVAAGLAFLADQFNPAYGLLRESPVVAPHRYWLATDNQLAVYALGTYSPTLAAVIAQTIRAYDPPRHGLIEVLDGQPIDWPPHVETQYRVQILGSDEIWTEHRLSGPRYADWTDYADLALYGALAAHRAGQSAEALARYTQALDLYDGVGFADKAQAAQGLYATYKLALAVHVGKVLGLEPDPGLVAALLAKQDATGGFVTLYDRSGVPQGDASTETTAHALLALQP